MKTNEKLVLEDLDKIIEILEIMLVDPVRKLEQETDPEPVPPKPKFGRYKLYDYMDKLMFDPDIHSRKVKPTLFDNIKSSTSCLKDLCIPIQFFSKPFYKEKLLEAIKVLDLFAFNLQEYFTGFKNLVLIADAVHNLISGISTSVWGLLSTAKSTLEDVRRVVNLLAAMHDTLKTTMHGVESMGDLLTSQGIVQKRLENHILETNKKLGTISKKLNSLDGVGANASICAQNLTQISGHEKSSLDVLNRVSTTNSQIFAKLESFQRFMEKHTDQKAFYVQFRKSNGAQESVSS